MLTSLTVSPRTAAVEFLIMNLLSFQLYSLQRKRIMCFDHVKYMATYFSQNTVPLRSWYTYQYVCHLCWPKAWTWLGSNNRHRIVLTMGHETTQTVFQSDQDPAGGWSNWSLGIFIGLWPEANGNVYHCCSMGLKTPCHSMLLMQSTPIWLGRKTLIWGPVAIIAGFSPFHKIITMIWIDYSLPLWLAVSCTYIYIFI